MVGVSDAVVLGIIQGLTEWLPVSSSAHMAIFSNLFSVDADLLFYSMLHIGTLMAVLVFFRMEIFGILKDVSRLDFSPGPGRMGLMVVIGTLPILVAGFALYNRVSAAFSSMTDIGMFLILTGIFLYCTRHVKAGKRDVDAKDALIVGLAQALAIFPGASRSGITMSAALARRIEPRKAFAFSFLLSVPAIICANAYELYRNLQVISYPVSYAIGYGSVLGILISFSVGYISLRILRRMIVERKLHYFAYYCWALGVALILSGF